MERFWVVSLLIAVVLLCCVVQGVIGDPNILEGVYSEEKLYKSEEWRNRSLSLFIITSKETDSVSNYISALEHILEETAAVLMKVSCDGVGSTTREVCQILSSHDAAIRKGSGQEEEVGVVGFDAPVDNLEGRRSEVLFIAAALQSLLVKGSVCVVKDHYALKVFASQHSSCLLALVADNSDAFVTLLKTALDTGIPTAITSTKSVLPLFQRPLYKPSPSPVHLWNIREFGQKWYSLKSKDVPAEEFVRRTLYPVKLDYSNDEAIRSLLKDSHLHYAYFFPALSGASDLNFSQFVDKVSERVYESFVCIIADRSRDSHLASRLLVTDENYYIQVVVMPFGEENNLAVIETESDDLIGETDHVAGIMASIAHDNRWSGDSHMTGGKDNKMASRLSVTDPSTLSVLVKQDKFHMVTIFCKIGVDGCPDAGYLMLRQFMNVINSQIMDQDVRSYAVECKTIKDVFKFKVKSLPSFAVYNHTEKVWHVQTGPPDSHRNILQLLAKHTGISGLTEIEAEMQDESPFIAHTLHPVMQEDDTFGLLARTIPNPTLPRELVLTSQNFDQSIQHFEKIAVVFYLSWSVRCKVFLNHVITAWTLLDEKAGDVSLGAVSCDDYTDLCSRYGVHTYPTALLFTPSTRLTPTPITTATNSIGTLDSVHLLKALGQNMKEEEIEQKLLEITPSTLPNLLRGSLKTPLVLWCDDHINSELGVAFTALAGSNRYSKLAFAWMNSSVYSELLSTILSTSDVTYPTVVALKLNRKAVYAMEQLSHDLAPPQFKEQLEVFLNKLSQDILSSTGMLSTKQWPPIRDPFQYPSELPHDNHDDDHNHSDDHDDNYDDHDDHYDDNRADHNHLGFNSNNPDLHFNDLNFDPNDLDLDFNDPDFDPNNPDIKGDHYLDSDSLIDDTYDKMGTVGNEFGSTYDHVGLNQEEEPNKEKYTNHDHEEL